MRHSISLFCGVALASVILLSGCSGAQGNTSSQTQQQSPPAQNQSTPATAPATQNQSASGSSQQTAEVTLAPENGSKAQGMATLVYDPQTQQMTVTVQMTGLEPNSSHPNHIHTGTCAAPGGPVYGLQTLQANADGTAKATTTLKQVNNPDFSHWIVNVHLGPSMDKTGSQPISCGPVVTTNK